MNLSPSRRELLLKTIAPILALVSLCGIAIGGWALAAGALGALVAYNLPAPPTYVQITPPPTSTPRVREIFSSPTPTLDARSAKKTRSAQTAAALTASAPGELQPTRAPGDLNVTQSPFETPGALGAQATLTPAGGTAAQLTLTASALTGPTLLPPGASLTPTAGLTSQFTATPSRTPGTSTTASNLTRTPTRTQPGSPSATRTPTRTESVPVFIDLVGDIAPVRPNQTAALSVKTIPNAICEIIYLTPDGREPRLQELSPLNSGADGICSWQWLIAANTPPGTGTVLITVEDFTKYFNIVILGG